MRHGREGSLFLLYVFLQHLDVFPREHVQYSNIVQSTISVLPHTHPDVD